MFLLLFYTKFCLEGTYSEIPPGNFKQLLGASGYSFFPKEKNHGAPKLQN